MKTHVFRSWLVLVLIGFVGLPAFGTEPTNVRIEFVRPERFTDFRIQNRGEIQSSKIFSGEMIRYLAPAVARRFPGATLSLRFTDIDLAGRYEPWRGPQFNDIRFIRDDTGPLKLFFDYQLTDSKGKVLASGPKRIVDVDFQRRFMIYANTGLGASLSYEKLELRDWVNSLARQTEKVASSK